MRTFRWLSISVRKGGNLAGCLRLMQPHDDPRFSRDRKTIRGTQRYLTQSTSITEVGGW